MWISAYWASLTIGRVIFGAVVNHVNVDVLLRACMAVAILGTVLIWLNVLPLVAVATIGLVLAPIFPVAHRHVAGAFVPRSTRPTRSACKWPAAVAGGAVLPALVGVLAARAGLEIVGPCLVVLGVRAVRAYTKC